MATKGAELTFIRCPSCRSLVPAVATRCRMCGHNLEEGATPQDDAASTSQPPTQTQERPEVQTPPVGFPQPSAETAPPPPPPQGSAPQGGFPSASESMFSSGAESQPHVAPPQQEPAAPAGEMPAFRVNPEAATPPPPPPSSPRRSPQQPQDSGNNGSSGFSSSSDDGQFRIGGDAAETVAPPTREPNFSANPETEDTRPQRSAGEISARKQSDDDARLPNFSANSDDNDDNSADDDGAPKKKRRRRRRKKKNAGGEQSASDSDTQEEEQQSASRSDGRRESQSKSRDEERKEKVASARDEQEAAREEVRLPKLEKESPKEVAPKKSADSNVEQVIDGSLIGWFVSFPGEGQKEVPREIRTGRYFVSGERLKKSDMVIPDTSISTPQCLVLGKEDVGVKIQDLMSINGTHIKRRGTMKYSLLTEAVTLAHGDWVKFGDFEAVVCLLPPYDDLANDTSGSAKSSKTKKKKDKDADKEDE